MIVVGEALVDLVAEDDGRLDPRHGGAGRNLAIAAARLAGEGVTVRWLGGLSRDRFGEAMADELAAEDVDLSTAVRTDDPTPLAIVDLDEDGGPSYSFHLDGSAAVGLTAADLDVPADETVHVSLGAVTLATPGTGEALRALLEARREVTRLTTLDPNVRPAFLGDPARQRQLLREAAAGCTVVRCSDEDLELLCGDGGAAPDEVVDGWLDAGATAVVVTRGGDGVEVRTDELTAAVEAVAGEVVDTVGAGDTFGAALLVGLAERDVGDADAVAAMGDEDWREVLAFAARAAAVTVGRRGADPPHRGDLDDPPTPVE